MATGDIKAGRGGLIGNAGEYYVVAELLKRNIVAALAPRNMRAFDVIALRGPHAARIRVKTKSDGVDPWQWAVKKNGDIFPELSLESDFTVLVNLALDRSRLAFYVLPTHVLNEWLVTDFQEWLQAPESVANRTPPQIRSGICFIQGSAPSWSHIERSGAFSGRKVWPNPRLQRTRMRAPLSRKPLGDER